MPLLPKKAALVVLLILALWATYRFILFKIRPRVIPGVPHNSRHAQATMGDMPAVGAFVSRAGCTQSEAVFAVVNRGPAQSAIAQLLTPAFMPQVVLIDDPREVEDILRRRGRELDRSAMTAAFFAPLLPRASIARFTTPDLKAQKKLWADSLTSNFLTHVVAPHARRSAGRLAELWRLQARAGRAFEAQPPLLNATMDLMWAVALGSDLGVLGEKLQAATRQPKLSPGGKPGEAVGTGGELNKAAESSRDMFFQVTQFLEDESAHIRSGSAAWRLKFIKLTPRYWRVRRQMTGEMQKLVAAARDRFQHRLQSQDARWDAEETCAMDLVLRRELVAAKKEELVKATDIEQELMLFMIAGIDSTAFTLAWCVKFLSSHAAVQGELREALRVGLMGLNGQGLPSAYDMATRNIPYLDAFLHETLRLAVTAGSVVRRVTTATQILGCHIPAGTELVLNTRVLQPPLPVDESLRSATSREAQQKRPRGGIEGPSGKDLEAFNPRRWLYPGENGADTFDAEALPTLIFSHGIRGCFEETDDWTAEEEIFRRPKHSRVNLKALV